MKQIIDISHPIQRQPCSFGVIDTTPQISFEEGESHGVCFITSRVDNLHSNTCTHIDFPGHLANLGRKFPKSVGMYPIERFVGRAFVADFSHKLAPIEPFFNKDGKLNISPRDDARVPAFLCAVDGLAITKEELTTLLQHAGLSLSSVSGLIIYSGLSSLWRYEKFESWEYAYFYSPFLTEGLCDLIVQSRLSFVGIDAFQLEHPIINFNGHELPLVLNQTAREMVVKKLDEMDMFSNHQALLGNDILVYENLRLPPEVKNRLVLFSGPPLNFRLEGMNDNALVRPYLSIIE
jgi:kynurenine formamidase